MFSGFRSLWAMPKGRSMREDQCVGWGHLAGVLARCMGARLAIRGTQGSLGRLARSRQHPEQQASAPTFIVQEVQGTGHVLHDHTGLQLVEVPSLVDVAQDGTWGRATVKGEYVRVTSVSPGHCLARPHFHLAGKPPLWPPWAQKPISTWHGSLHSGLPGPKVLDPELLFGQETDYTNPFGCVGPSERSSLVALSPQPIRTSWTRLPGPTYRPASSQTPGRSGPPLRRTQ